MLDFRLYLTTQKLARRVSSVYKSPESEQGTDRRWWYMDVEEIKKEFGNRKRDFSALEEEARFILAKALKREKIKTHSMPSRVKELDSFLDKVKRKESTKPFEDIRDIVGLRVVYLFLSDIPKVGQVIRDSFNVLSEDDKIESTEVSSFGYMSVHFTAEMKKEYKGPRYDTVAGMPFEVQVRTILVDAWANVSHYLAYKTDIDVPSNLKRDFYALSGLFYIADSHFELFFRSSKESQAQAIAQVSSASKPQLAQQEINLDSMTAYLRARFPDREHKTPPAVSDLVSELSQAGYRTIGQIDEILDRTDAAFQQYERDLPPTSSFRRFSDVGVVRVCLCVVDDNFNALVMKDVAGGPKPVDKKYKDLVVPR
jgi:putative GTP pyrophosphokinase